MDINELAKLLNRPWESLGPPKLMFLTAYKQFLFYYL